MKNAFITGAGLFGRAKPSFRRVLNLQGLYANAPVSIPSPFYRIVISRVQAFPFILVSSTSSSLPLPPSTCFTAINVPPNRETRHANTLSFINSPDKLIHEAGDGLINLPLPLHNDRWIVRRGPSSGYRFPRLPSLARHQNNETLVV